MDELGRSPLLPAPGVDTCPWYARWSVVLAAWVVLLTLAGALVLLRFDGPDEVAAEPTAADLTAFLASPDRLAPVAGADGDERVELGELLRRTHDDLAGWWDRTLPLTYGGTDAVPAGLAPYLPSGSGPPPCGDPHLEAAWQAFYCPIGDFIAWDAEQLMPGLHRRFGDLAPPLVLAHEWAHVAQNRGAVRGTTFVLELQADCFAGAWVAEVSDPVLVAVFSGGAAGASAFFAWAGDPVDTEIPVEDRHGTAGQRLAAFRDGQERGATACVLYETALPPSIEQAGDPDA